MIRSIAAVLIGLAVTFALVLIFHQVTILLTGVPLEGQASGPYLAVNTAASFVAGVFGGATAARIAARAPQGHTIALAIAILILSLPTLFMGAAPEQPSWYPLLMSVVGPISVMVGGVAGGWRWQGRKMGDRGNIDPDSTRYR